MDERIALSAREVGRPCTGGADLRRILVGCVALLWLMSLLSTAHGQGGYQVLAPLPAASNGPTSPSGLIQSVDGNFYGTTYLGGSAGLGSVFRVTPTPTWTLTTLCSFPSGGADGSNPTQYAGLIRLSDGNFYGTTMFGGASDKGTIFKCQPTSPTTGILTRLYEFSGSDGAHPVGGLVTDTAGNLYGTTSGTATAQGPACSTDADGCGTIFMLSPNGDAWTRTTLYTFTGDENGASPHGALAWDSLGNLYGTTSAGGNPSCDAGARGCGTIFKLAYDGATWTLTTLYTFGGWDGAHPHAGMVQGTDGSFYGTTGSGGGTGYGTVFQMTSTGYLGTLHTFTGTADGAYPYSALTKAADGNLYGATFVGGTSDRGTLYQLSPSGDTWVFASLYHFSNADGPCSEMPVLGDGGNGACPQVSPIQGSDGKLYGTTSRGGAQQSGVVYVLQFLGLTVTKNGLGSGTVSSASAGIDCGTVCNKGFAFGTIVTLEAVPASGSAFTGWSGAGCSGTGSCTVTMDQARTVNATFTLDAQLMVNKSGAGTGTITAAPVGINCGATCNFTYPGSTSVTLTAAATSGCTFTGWSGACTGTGTCTVLMSVPRTVTATFADPILPVITHSPVTSWKENTAIPITATITDNLGVQGATLYYRTMGVGGFSSLPMTPGTVYSRSIPAGVVVRPAGVEYYLEAADAAGNVRRLPSGSGTYPVVVGTRSFTDDPLVAGTTAIKAAHFTELRTAIAALAPFSWVEPTPTPGGIVRAAVLTELRTALTAAYAAKGKPAPSYTDPSPKAGVVIKALHLNELRALVRALE